jgi:small subunit ribosomal protein S16
MSLIIRLQRVGKKKQPVFRIALAEKHRAADKTVKEVLGHYNPRTKEFAIRDEERLKYWIAQHIPLSATVHNLLVTKGILSGAKVRAWMPKKKPAALPAEQAASQQQAPETSALPETTAEAKAEGSPQPEAKPEQSTETTPEPPAERVPKAEAASETSEEKAQEEKAEVS